MKAIAEKLSALVGQVDSALKQLNVEKSQAVKDQREAKEAKSDFLSKRRELSAREKAVKGVEDTVEVRVKAQDALSEAYFERTEAKKEREGISILAKEKNIQRAEQQKVLDVRAKGLNSKEERLLKGEAKLKADKKSYKQEVLDELARKVK